jgi:hypothetical protein
LRGPGRKPCPLVFARRLMKRRSDGAGGKQYALRARARAHLEPVYSCLSAVVGSTELARKAGIKPADPAAKARTTAEPMNVNGSRGFNPKSWLRIRLARASASEKPAARLTARAGNQQHQRKRLAAGIPAEALINIFMGRWRALLTEYLILSGFRSITKRQ